MKREGIAYGPVIGYTALLIAASGALGWVVTGSWYPLAILLVPVIGIAAYRLIGLYSDSIRRVTFMFNAIDNDDFTFRFHEDPSKVDNGMLNAALNRIKEILVRAKVRAEERERYYQLIMEYARTGLITINDAGSVYQANGEALRIFGLPRLTHIQQLELPAPEAYRVLTTIRPGEKHHVSCVTETGEMGLSLGCSQIVLEKRRLRVVVISDINSELSEMQIESWSKLTRILTHEIMNSLAPITSLSDTLLHIDQVTPKFASKIAFSIAPRHTSLIAYCIYPPRVPQISYGPTILTSKIISLGISIYTTLSGICGNEYFSAISIAFKPIMSATLKINGLFCIFIVSSSSLILTQSSID